MNNIENNLFYYANSELSQDSFICWLFSFLKDPEKHVFTKMHDETKNMAQKFVDMCIADQYSSYMKTDRIVVKEIKAQYSNIDVLLLCEVIHQDNSKHSLAIIIEDKVNTIEHDDQLTRYKEIVKAKYENYEVIGIYYKTGFQSNISEIRKSGFKNVNRKLVVDFFKNNANLEFQNSILEDYKNYILNLDYESEKFRTLDFSEWKWSQINGFYNELHLNESKYFGKDVSSEFGYVPNPQGGFNGMWFDFSHFLVKETKITLYLQMEFRDINEIKNQKPSDFRIVIKVSIDDKDEAEIDHKSIRDKLVGDYIDKKKSENNSFVRPVKFRSGKTMTLGIFKKSFDKFINSELILQDCVKSFDIYKQKLLDDKIIHN